MFVISGVLGHNERTCIQRAKDIQSDTLKKDQFGTWLKAENHAISSGYQRREGGHTTNEGHTMVRDHNSNLIEGRIGAGTRRNLQHLEKKVDSTNALLGSMEDDHHGLDQNESKETGHVNLDGNVDNALNIKDSNMIQPMEVTKYGPQEKQTQRDWLITGKGTSADITVQFASNCSGKKEICTQLQLDKTVYDDTLEGMEEAIKINMKERQSDINQT